MKTEFKLIGLTKPNRMTCEPLNNDNIFWVESGLTKEVFKSLFEYCKGNWKDKKIVLLKHDGINKDGTPIKPEFIEVIDKN